MTDTTREIVGYGLVLAWTTTLLVFADSLSAVGRFLGATVALFLAVKVGAWVLLRARGREFNLSPLAFALFWTVWPGVRPDLFANGDAEDAHATPDGRTFVVGYLFTMVGVVLAVASLLAPPVLGEGPASWLVLFAVLAVVHSGFGRMLPFGLRWLGIAVPPLFDDPLQSRGVGDFWSVRWNRPFVDMNRLYLTGPLSTRLGMGAAATLAFGVSGLLHELAISYTAGGGWGTPMIYFVLQAGGYAVEHRWLPDADERSLFGRLWTYTVVLGPLPLLFHWPFRSTFLVPLVEGGRSLLLSHPLSAYVAAGLWIGAAGHFLILVASYQVPGELEWEEDLQSLKPFNRKVMWTYGGFIVLTIVAFGSLTALFHEQFVAGTPVALGLAGFVAIYWTARILVDAFYYSHDDWPEGPKYEVGHAMLTSLFALLVVIYGGTIAYHLT